MRSLVLLILTVCYFNLKSTACVDPRAKYYRDVDYWTLEGVAELNEAQLNEYPYFKILELDAENRIIEMVSETNFYAEHYVRKGNSWMLTSERTGNTSHVYQYTFVSKSKILILEYLAVLDFREGKGPTEEKLLELQKQLRNKKHFLVSLSLIDSTGRRNYYLPRDSKIKQKPYPNFDERLSKLRIEYVDKQSYKIVNDTLVEETKNQTTDEVVSIICYALKDKWGYRHNTFWPLFFPKRLTCDK